MSWKNKRKNNFQTVADPSLMIKLSVLSLCTLIHDRHKPIQALVEGNKQLSYTICNKFIEKFVLIMIETIVHATDNDSESRVVSSLLFIIIFQCESDKYNIVVSIKIMIIKMMGKN